MAAITFSKRSTAPAKAAAAAPLPGLGGAMAGLVSNPYVGAGGAGLLFMGLLLGLVAITGNPDAGQPSIRMALSQALTGTMIPEGWREALAAEPANEAALTAETFELSEDEPLGHGGGQAVITLPAGAHAAGIPSALTPAPIMGLTAPGPGGGLLPIIGVDGTTPAKAYARPFHADGRPRVALIVGGLGLNEELTRRAIAELPPEVTLSFSAAAADLQGWIDQARAAGHEVLLETPMQPADYPSSDAGKDGLAPGDSAQELAAKLEWTLSRASGYFGVTNYMGSGFLAAPGQVAALSAHLKKRGLAFIDDGQPVARNAALPGVPRASAPAIDDNLSVEGVRAGLAALEANASRNGGAIGSGFAYAMTVNQAVAWAKTATERGFQLAPASALMR